MANAARIDGADISHWQSGTLDMAKAKKNGVKWLFHKATEGTTYKDPNYAKRRAEAKQAGLPFGAYHFAKANSSVAAQAKHFLATASPQPGDMRPMLDFEESAFASWTPAKRTAWVKEFVTAVQKATGVPPFIYTPFDLTDTFNCPLWVARYSDAMNPPVVRKPWKTWTVWQFSNGQYGNPKSVPGLGNVDLNTVNMDPAKFVKTFTLAKPAPPKPAKKTRRLKIAHASLQFSDSSKQHTADIEKIFSLGYDIIGGTEAGPGAGNTSAELKRCAEKYGYRLSITSRYDTWAAIKKSIITPGSFKSGADFAVWRGTKQTPKPPGNWSDKAVVWVQADIPDIGTLSLGAVHYVTNGGAGAALKKKLDADYAKVINTWSKAHGKGSALAFITGDVNLSDKTNDVFKGLANMSTCWDDLKKWPNTGHGNIDIIARYKGDGRVKFVGAKVLDDKALFLNTDHFLIEATVEIVLKGQ